MDTPKKLSDEGRKKLNALLPTARAMASTTRLLLMRSSNRVMRETLKEELAALLSVIKRAEDKLKT